MASYNSVAKILHWVIALSILFMLVLGWLMSDREIPNRYALFQLHKSVGICVLLLSFVRIGWRLVHKAPPALASIAAWQQKLAHAVHGLLYVLMVAMPLSGWLIVSSSPRNIPTMLFGVVPWPHLPIGQDQDLSHMMGEMHETLAAMLVVLFLMHAGAALWHHFIMRDETLLRMSPTFLHGLLKKLRWGS